MNALFESCGCEGEFAATAENHPPRILVVEDDPLVRELSTEALTRSGYQVDAAEDGDAGLNAASAIQYDLIITDNVMPRLSGVELAARLRLDHSEVPMILTSGTILTKFEDVHFNGVLLKPYFARQLLEMVHRILAPSQASVKIFQK